MTKLLFQSLQDHIGLCVTNSPIMRDCFSNRIASSSPLLRTSLLHKLHAAHWGSEFTLRHARNCVFWPGLHSQITNMCQSCVICAQHVHQHPREPLQPYPVPTLPWQLLSQDLFELNGRAYIVTVDQYSDFYEIDNLPTIQSSAVIQASKQHFGRHGIPHTLITDSGAQFTFDLFRTFSR